MNNRNKLIIKELNRLFNSDTAKLVTSSRDEIKDNYELSVNKRLRRMMAKPSRNTRYT